MIENIHFRYSFLTFQIAVCLLLTCCLYTLWPLEVINLIIKTTR